MKKNYSNIESLNENAQTHDLIEILPSCTSDIPIPNASIDPNEVVINTTLEGSPTYLLQIPRPAAIYLFTNVT